MFETEAGERTFVVWLDDEVCTRVRATDWFEAVRLAVPRFAIDLDPDRLLVTIGGETVRCADVRGARTIAVELAA